MFQKSYQNKLRSILTGIVSGSLLLVGCEGVKWITCTVVSQKTGLPLSNVKISSVSPKPDPSKSDLVTGSSGKFKITTQFTSLMFGGPKLKFTLSKDGYKTQFVTTKHSIDTIRLETDQ